MHFSSRRYVNGIAIWQYYTAFHNLKELLIKIYNFFSYKKSNLIKSKDCLFLFNLRLLLRFANVISYTGYLQHSDYNVIVIDWSSISIRPYIWASKRVVLVGRFVTTMINFLVKHGMDSSQTKLVGHSLGAHVVGIAARNADSDIGYVVGKFSTFYV